MRTFRLKAAHTTLAGAALLMAAASANAQDAVKLGFTAALTGPFNEFGEGIRRGAEIAVEQWNKAGGVNGKKVELAEVLDDQLIPDRALQNMRRILDNKDVVALMAPSGSGPVLAIVDMVAADGRPICNPQAQTPSIVYPNGPDKPPRKNVFSVSISNAVEAEKLGRVMAAAHKNIGILHESTGYGVTGADLAKKEIASLNKDAKVTVESYNQRAQDMTAQLVRMQRAGAEALLVIGLGADFAVIRKNMSRLNLNVPLYGTAGAVTVPYIEGAGDLVVGTRAANSIAFGRRPMSPTIQKFLEAYRAKYGTDRWYGNDPENPIISMASTVGSGYDCVNLLLDAIKRAGSTERGAIIRALEQTKNFPGVMINSISFSPSEHTALRVDDLGIYEMVKKDSRLLLELKP